MIRDAAGAARVVQVITGGFAEAGADGAALKPGCVTRRVKPAYASSDPTASACTRPPGRQTFQLDASTDVGRVSVVSQSGGLAGDIVKVGARRGLQFSKVLSIGNAVDVTPGEIVEHLVADDATQVVGAYVEGGSDGERLVDAFRAARRRGQAGRRPHRRAQRTGECGGGVAHRRAHG